MGLFSLEFRHLLSISPIQPFKGSHGLGDPPLNFAMPQAVVGEEANGSNGDLGVSQVALVGLRPPATNFGI